MDGYHSLIHWVRLSSRNLCKQEWSLCERQLDWLLGSERPVWGPGGQEVPVRGRHDYWWDNKQQWGAHRGRESRIPDPHICNVGGYLAPLWHIGESGAGPNPMWLLFYNNRFTGVMHNALCHENVFFSPFNSCITVSSMFECSVFTVTPLEGPYLEFYVNEVELHIHWIIPRTRLRSLRSFSISTRAVVT